MSNIQAKMPPSDVKYLFYSKGSGSDASFNSMETPLMKFAAAHALLNIQVEANGMVTSFKDVGDSVATWLDSKSCSMCPGGADDDGGAINI